MLVNGLVYPYVEVQPRKYRFRVLNACNARFCNLRLFYAQGADFPLSTEPALHKPGLAFLPRSETRLGFFRRRPGQCCSNQVLLAPSERADLIVDFSNIPPRRHPDPVQRCGRPVPQWRLRLRVPSGREKVVSDHDTWIWARHARPAAVACRPTHWSAESPPHRTLRPFRRYPACQSAGATSSQT